LWRAHHCGRISCANSEWVAGFLAARCVDRNRHLLCRSFYVHDFVPVHSRKTASAASRLGLRDSKKICAMERAAPCPHVDFCQHGPRMADRNRVFTCSAASLRGEHTFTGTEEQSCQSRASRDHAQNADALGASPRHPAREQSATTARRLAEDCRALERASGRGQNQKLLHAGCALSFTTIDAVESRTVEQN